MNIIQLDVVESTNVYAKSNFDLFKDETIICALRQTSGKGRFSRKWIDLGEGNLFVSFVLKPSSNYISSYQNLTQYLSVCLCKIFEEYGVIPQIKWPNDVLIDGKKIAGILCESVTNNGNIIGLVLGLGVNLNVKKSNFNLVPDRQITSLNIELGEFVDNNKFLNRLAELFFLNYNIFLESGFNYIKPDYMSRLSLLGSYVSVQVLNEIKSGIADSVTDNGELVLSGDGDYTILSIGDIL